MSPIADALAAEFGIQRKQALIVAALLMAGGAGPVPGLDEPLRHSLVELPEGPRLLHPSGRDTDRDQAGSRLSAAARRRGPLPRRRSGARRAAQRRGARIGRGRMKRPVIERRKPDTAELRRRHGRRQHIARLTAEHIARAVEAGFRSRELGEAMIEAGARLVASATDGQGAASVLGATSGRVSPALACGTSWRGPEAALRGDGR